MTLFLDILKNLVAGMVVGGVFALLKLPVPAPPALPPVFAILGITLGFMLVLYLLKNLG
jgi:XapX domain-containing protein